MKPTHLLLVLLMLCLWWTRVARAQENSIRLSVGEAITIRCDGNQILPLPLSRTAVEVSCWNFKVEPTETSTPTITPTPWETYQHIPTRTVTPYATGTPVLRMSDIAVYVK